MTAATPSSGGTPGNTLDAVYDILRNPTNHVVVLDALLPATPAFMPVTASAVPEWTLAVTWSGGGMDLPTAMTFDSSGDAWVVSYYGVLTELPPLGAGGEVQQMASPSAGLMENYGLTVDGANNIWVANEHSSGSINSGYGNIVKFSPTGQGLSSANGFSAGGVYFPQGLAADTTGNVWVADYGDSLMTLLSSSGSAMNSGKGWSLGQLYLPVAVVVDANHNAWVANQSSSTITRRRDGTGQPILPECFCVGRLWVCRFGCRRSHVSGGGQYEHLSQRHFEDTLFSAMEPWHRARTGRAWRAASRLRRYARRA